MTTLDQRAPILPGAKIGLLGGGQLGRMFVQAATQAGYQVTVLAPSLDEPAAQIAHEVVVADYDDLDQVERLARSVDVITTEFENVPADSLERAEAIVPVRPSSRVFAIAQDREVEKRTLSELGLPVAPYAVIRRAEDLLGAVESVGTPAILKRATAGYDGHGQRAIHTADAIESAWEELGAVRAILERRIDFDAEISMLGVRGADGQIATYEPVLNHHHNHVLDVSICPAPISDAVHAEAQRVTTAILEGLHVVGVVCVEFFLCPDGALMVNEIAPRPHNSGHLTIEAHVCNQFQQQVRSVCGMPLGSTSRKVPAVAMANLLGDLWAGGTPNWVAAHDNPEVQVHVYGKSVPSSCRKMGHITATSSSVREAEMLVREARDRAGRRTKQRTSPSMTTTL